MPIPSILKERFSNLIAKIKKVVNVYNFLKLFVFKEYPCLLDADVGNGWEFALFQVVEVQRLAFYDETALKGVALT